MHLTFALFQLLLSPIPLPSLYNIRIENYVTVLLKIQSTSQRFRNWLYCLVRRAKFVSEDKGHCKEILVFKISSQRITRISRGSPNGFLNAQMIACEKLLKAFLLTLTAQGLVWFFFFFLSSGFLMESKHFIVFTRAGNWIQSGRPWREARELEHSLTAWNAFFCFSLWHLNVPMRDEY